MMSNIPIMERPHLLQPPWLILYDGVCGWCTGWVRFLLKRDSTKQFKFSSLQSSLGQRILAQFKLSSRDFTTFVLLTPQGPYTKSTAVVKICQQIKGFKMFGKILFWIPQTLRDKAYDLIARNRYHLRGKLSSCYLPPKEFVDRFVQDDQWEGEYSELYLQESLPHDSHHA